MRLFCSTHEGRGHETATIPPLFRAYSQIQPAARVVDFVGFCLRFLGIMGNNPHVGVCVFKHQQPTFPDNMDPGTSKLVGLRAT